MTKIPNNKPVYDLEERTFQFAKAIRLFVKILPQTIANIEDGEQNSLGHAQRRRRVFVFGILDLFGI